MSEADKPTEAAVKAALALPIIPGVQVSEMALIIDRETKLKAKEAVLRLVSRTECECGHKDPDTGLCFSCMAAAALEGA